MNEKIAIVCTLIDAENVIDSFIKYHTYIGFDHFFLFFDRPNDPSISKALKYHNVTIIQRNTDLEEKWKETNNYHKFKYFINTEVMARQVLNASVATKMSLENNIDWLLHIDIDELFYSPNISLKKHLHQLKEKKVNCIRYLNYEAIPQKFDINDYFREVTTFKKHPNLVEKYKLVQDKNYIISYVNGKSAIRIDHNEYGKNLEPIGVHSFQEHEYYINDFPIILHYYSCGYDNLIKKYQTLGDFSDKWFDKKEIMTQIPFHINARDIIKKLDKSEIKKLYKSNIMLFENDVIEYLIKSELFCRIESPKQILELLKQ
ncbi:MAG: glycosyltransferase family 2 protein [Candidatus Sericytochromatia bacterium]|nr:glycosyltransferase family 2 protein [Candidatus Sericytochromatia bacterium]